MTPRAKRAWGIGLIVFFLLMVGFIAYGQHRADQNAYACQHHLPGCPYTPR
jgi:cbb3-type cytochrome oxidase subunit 3